MSAQALLDTDRLKVATVKTTKVGGELIISRCYRYL